LYAAGSAQSQDVGDGQKVACTDAGGQPGDQRLAVAVEGAAEQAAQATEAKPKARPAGFFTATSFKQWSGLGAIRSKFLEQKAQEDAVQKAAAKKPMIPALQKAAKAKEAQDRLQEERQARKKKVMQDRAAQRDAQHKAVMQQATQPLAKGSLPSELGPILRIFGSS
jgi:hypothetical protein